MKKDSFLKAFGYICVTVFVFAALACIVSAAAATGNIYTHAEDDYACSTASAYLTQKLHRCGTVEDISIIKGDEGDVIVIDNKDETFTSLFCANKELQEVRAYSGVELGENSGQTIVKASSLKADIKNGLIEVTVYFENAKSETVFVCLYGQNETER